MTQDECKTVAAVTHALVGLRPGMRVRVKEEVFPNAGSSVKDRTGTISAQRHSSPGWVCVCLDGRSLVMGFRESEIEVLHG